MPAVTFKSDIDRVVKNNLFATDNALTIMTHFRLCLENHAYQLKPKFVNVRITVDFDNAEQTVYHGCMESNVDRDLLHLLWHQSDCNFILTEALRSSIHMWVKQKPNVKFVTVGIDDII